MAMSELNAARFVPEERHQKGYLAFSLNCQALSVSGQPVQPRSKVRGFAIGYNDSHSDRSAYGVFEKPPTMSGFWIHAQP
jgi:hypothetical protein